MDMHSHKPTISKLAAGVALAAGAVLLAGCGGGGGAKQASPQAQGERYVFTSAKDCAESGKLDMQRCGDAIDAAITAHLTSAPTYKSLYSCEKAEGIERCERTEEATFRPRLVAYLVTINAGAATALPLYCGTPEDKGFRQSDKKKVLLVTDDTLTYSQSSMGAYEANRGGGKGSIPKT